MARAIIVGTTSGIGLELARVLSVNGYALGLAGRRADRLAAIEQELSSEVHVRCLDIRDPVDAQQGFLELVERLGGADLLVIAAGVGFLNPELRTGPELETVSTNVQGFTALADAGFRYFLSQGRGHLLGISSISAIRGSGAAPAYNASKAYVSVYLGGLRQKAAQMCPDIVVTEIQPGFVDTAMAKGEGLFWVAPASQAAEQIYGAIRKRRSHAYVTRRWRLVAWLLKILPDFLYNKL